MLGFKPSRRFHAYPAFANMKLHRNLLLRRIALPVLKALNRNITIKHPWTQDKIELSLFEHKGYWFHGKNREQQEMTAFGCLIGQRSTVLEVGGHIGFMSLFFSRLVGERGKVIVFEPGPNNLPYLRKNAGLCGNIDIVAAACSDSSGEAILFTDNLTGLNNSLVPVFKGLCANARYAPGVSVATLPVAVQTVRLDSYCKQVGVQPDFIKIDVEGHELAVLNGAQWLLNQGNQPMLMVEIQADHGRIVQMLRDRGYCLYRPNGQPIAEDRISTNGNIFALHPARHGVAIERWHSHLM